MSKRALVSLAALVAAGCPVPEGGATTNATSGPSPQPDAPIPPNIEGNVCDHVSGGGADETGSGAACPTPEVTSDALELRWLPGYIDRLGHRSVVTLIAHNRLRQPVEAELRVVVNMKGSDDTKEMPLPPRFEKFTIPPNRSKHINVNLQLAYTLGVLREGPAEVHVSAKLIAPVETSMEGIDPALLSAKLDSRGRVYEVDFLDE